MNKHQVEPKCAQCGISESSHQDLYHTPLGLLTFSFRPDQGETIHGEAPLCRPCTHEVLSHRILHASGVPQESLAAEVWN